ncbi:MAG: hypothetical protein E7300_09765 [Lachnospiraceae bacterium]|nr:hypothetical protein [Lachnospiraceae bacterium]
MFKEFAAGCLALLILFVICKIIRKKSPRALSIIIWSVLGLCVVLQIIYNCIVMFPDYYMETPHGMWRFATFSENLLAYNDGWDFRDEILQPILKHRSIILDASAPYYRKYFELLSPACETTFFEKRAKESVFAHQTEFDFKTTFETFRIMDYVKESDTIPAELTAMFEADTSPDLYIHMNSAKEEDALVCLVDDNHAVYILGKKKFEGYLGASESTMTDNRENEGSNTESSAEGGAEYVQ